MKNNNTKRVSQYDVVLNHLKKHKKITSYEAIYEMGISRLSGIIFNIKKDGYNISSKLVKVNNRYGGTAHVAEYTLIED